MNPIMRIAGVAVLGGLASGCSMQPLSDADPDLARYDTDNNKRISTSEADILLTDKFDVKPRDGQFSDEEVLDVVRYARKLEGVLIGDYSTSRIIGSMENILYALVHRLNEQEGKAKKS